MPQDNSTTAQKPQISSPPRPVPTPIAPAELAQVSGAGPNGGSKPCGPNGGCNYSSPTPERERASGWDQAQAEVVANLFRREVFESHRQAWLGTVQLTRPVPLWVATGFVLGVAILVGVFLWTGEYAR